MMQWLSRRRRDERGQSMVEFALVLPVILLILFAITEFGLVFEAQLTLSHLARAGARLATVGATDAEIIDSIRSGAVGLDLDALEIGISPTDAARPSGATVTVTLRYTFSVVIPLISDIVGTDLPLVAALSMRVE